MKRILVIATALALGTACTRSGLGEGEVVGDTSPNTGTSTGSTPTGLVCAWEGTWDLAKAFCSQIDLAAEGTFFDRYTATTMVITDTGNGDGNCDVTFHWEGPACAETEIWEISGADAADQMSIRFTGITACNPDSCQFDASDDDCLVGDRTDANVQSFDLDLLQAGQFRLTGLLDFSYPECVLDFITEWRIQ